MSGYLRTPKLKALGLVLAAVLMLLGLAASVFLGFARIHPRDALDAYLAFNGSNEHLIIRTARVPRALIATAVGASLAVAGALMQAFTRNPLASPSLFGINSGAAFALVVVSALWSLDSLTTVAWASYAGAALAAVMVYALGSIGRDGMTPIKVTLAGSAMTALFSSLTSGVLLVNGRSFDQVLGWLVGSVADRNLDTLLLVLPYIAGSLLAAFAMAGSVNLLSMGDEVARGLGGRTALIRAAMAVIVVLLAGASVAIAGPIAFVGIVIPHLSRALVGPDHRWLLPMCALLGANLLLFADTGARFILPGKETPVGVVTALIGIPFLIAVARRQKHE